jgi:ectoine hydroxylase-related dioxygenase (phytanoyl-CoA dioxygenase family)
MVQSDSGSSRSELFKIPCYTYHIPAWKDIKDQFLNDMNWEDSECLLGYYWSDFYKYYTKQKKPPYHTSLMELLKPAIDDFATLQGEHLKIPGSWCQNYASNQSHPVHTHGVVGFSAVFYAQLDPCQQPTSFISPFPDPWSTVHQQVQPNCNEGDVIFFPSQLMHMSLPNKIKSDRIIFSFNVFPWHAQPK